MLVGVAFVREMEDQKVRKPLRAAYGSAPAHGVSFVMVEVDARARSVARVRIES